MSLRLISWVFVGIWALTVGLSLGWSYGFTVLSGALATQLWENPIKSKEVTKYG